MAKQRDQSLLRPHENLSQKSKGTTTPHKKKPGTNKEKENEGGDNNLKMPFTGVLQALGAMHTLFMFSWLSQEVVTTWSCHRGLCPVKRNARYQRVSADWALLPPCFVSLAVSCCAMFHFGSYGVGTSKRLFVLQHCEVGVLRVPPKDPCCGPGLVGSLVWRWHRWTLQPYPSQGTGELSQAGPAVSATPLTDTL